jgi:CRISPR-associated protein Cmr6
MFHLGGVGQGARRPCYSRQDRDRPPWWRGSTLIPKSEIPFGSCQESVAEFQKLFQKRLGSFFEALKTLTEQAINPRQPTVLAKLTGINGLKQWMPTARL